MDIQTLRYIIVIEQLGSYSCAAKQLFVSQSSISRAITALEAEMGFLIFRRHNHGVIPTEEGKNLITKIRPLIKELDQISRKQFANGAAPEFTLMVAAQKSMVNSVFFARFAQKYCSNMEMSNLIFLEKPTDDVLNLVSEGTFDLGILHCTSNQENMLMDKFKELGLEAHLIEQSKVCVQVRKDHPLAHRKSLKTSDLEPYPRITYVNEDVTEYNYCSDIEVQKKRILISDRGALRDMVDHTNGFYIVCNYSKFEVAELMNRVFIPLEEADYRIKTIWFKKINSRQNQIGKNFTDMLEEIYRDSGAIDI